MRDGGDERRIRTTYRIRAEAGFDGEREVRRDDVDPRTILRRPEYHRVAADARDVDVPAGHDGLLGHGVVDVEAADDVRRIRGTEIGDGDRHHRRVALHVRSPVVGEQEGLRRITHVDVVVVFDGLRGEVLRELRAHGCRVHRQLIDVEDDLGTVEELAVRRLEWLRRDRAATDVENRQVGEDGTGRNGIDGDGIAALTTEDEGRLRRTAEARWPAGIDDVETIRPRGIQRVLAVVVCRHRQQRRRQQIAHVL